MPGFSIVNPVTDASSNLVIVSTSISTLESNLTLGK